MVVSVLVCCGHVTVLVCEAIASRISHASFSHLACLYRANGTNAQSTRMPCAAKLSLRRDSVVFHCLAPAPSRHRDETRTLPPLSTRRWSMIATHQKEQRSDLATEQVGDHLARRQPGGVVEREQVERRKERVGEAKG